MAISFSLRDTDKIAGYVIGSSVPAGNVEATEAQLALWRTVKSSLASQRRAELPIWTGTTVVEPADTRPIFSIVPDRALSNVNGEDVVAVLADGVDTVTFTITAFEADGTTVRTGLNGDRFYEVDEETFWRVTFVSGVATKLFRTTTLGFRQLFSNRRIKLKQEGRILAHE